MRTLTKTVLVVLTIVAGPAFGLDAACTAIYVPPVQIDSNTTFAAAIAVRNNGPESLLSVPVSFNIVRAANPADTVYHDTARVEVSLNQTRTGWFTRECTLEPGFYTMSGIIELPGDSIPANDTCKKSLFVRYCDVAVELLRPLEHEEPGLVPVEVRLTNLGNAFATVPSVIVKILPSGYRDSLTYVTVGLGQNKVVELHPWITPSDGEEVATAWVSYPDDMYSPNDTDATVVQVGVSGLAEGGGSDLRLTQSLLNGSVARLEWISGETGPASVTLFDIEGRVVARHCPASTQAKEVSLDLHSLRTGVYLVRLDDGRSVVTRKLVVQR